MLAKAEGPARLRELLARGGLIVAPGVFDGLSARIAEAAGFDALYVSGGAIARSMGYPDIGLVTQTEMVKRIEEIRAVTRLPLIVDADTGYGNAINVIRTVRAYERAGAAALHIEDQVEPKRCGHYEGKEVVPAWEMVQKVEAAVAARENPDFVIIARTDARAVLGLEEAIRRAQLYARAGADVIFVEAPQSEEEMQRIAREVPAPLLINMFWGGKTPLVEPRRLEQWGYRIMIVPSDLQRAAIRAMQRAAQALRRDGHTWSIRDELATFQEREQVVGLEEIQRLQERFLRAAPEA